MEKHKRNLAEKITQLLEKKHLLSAQQLVIELSKSGTTFNKTSIYRALDKLVSDSIVCTHYFSEHELVYELRDHHHDHVLCTQCGLLHTTLCQETLPTVLAGMTITHHHTTFYGTCADCAQKRAAKNQEAHQSE